MHYWRIDLVLPTHYVAATFRENAEYIIEDRHMEKQSIRASLIENIEAELKKDADDIDGDFIDCGIDELNVLDGLTPPTLDDGALNAAARAVRARAAWGRRNTHTKTMRKRRFIRRTIRGVCAACYASLLLLSASQLTALVTGSCLPSKIGITLCCGTKYCLCETAEAKVETGDHFP
jgi:hypothetical protein